MDGYLRNKHYSWYIGIFVIGLVVILVGGASLRKLSIQSESPVVFAHKQLANQDSTYHYTIFGARHMQPGKIQRVVYEMMEKCTGVDGDFDNISWTRADFIVTMPQNREVYAFWQILDDSNLRRIAVQSRWRNNPTLLSHESLHDIFNGTVRADVAEHCIIRNTGFPPGR